MNEVTRICEFFLFTGNVSYKVPPMLIPDIFGGGTRAKTPLGRDCLVFRCSPEVLATKIRQKEEAPRGKAAYILFISYKFSFSTQKKGNFSYKKVIFSVFLFSASHSICSPTKTSKTNPNSMICGRESAQMFPHSKMQHCDIIALLYL